MNQNVVDLSFKAVTAYQQAGMLFAGFAVFVLGLFFFGDWLYWRLHAEKVMGRITSARQDGKSSYPVYHYTLANGKSFDATSAVGTGTDSFDYSSVMNASGDVELMVFPDYPEIARPTQGISGKITLIIGSFLSGIGLLFFITACVDYPFTKMTFIMLAGFAIYSAIHFQRVLFPQTKRMPFAEWKAAMYAKQKAQMDALPLQPIAQVTSSPTMQAAVTRNAQARPQMKSLLILVAPAMIVMGIFFGWTTLQLTLHGVRAQGIVTSLDGHWSTTSQSHQNYIYNPIVDFKTLDGQSIHFRDRVGSNPPSYQPGATVTVLYMQDSPAKSAAIDHGLGNWIAPGFLFLFGLFIFIVGLKMSGKPRPT